MDIAERTLQLKTDIDEVYEAGKKAQYDEFWENVKKISRANSNDWYWTRYLFMGPGWNDSTFNPPYGTVMKPIATTEMFRRCGVSDLEAIFIRQNLTLDLTSVKWGDEMFGNSEITVIPEFIGTPFPYRAFYGCEALHTIRKFKVSKTYPFHTTTFQNCSALANITFEGTIGSSVSFSSSPLTVESMKNIISCLEDYAGTSNEYKYTVTFKTSAFNTLEAEGATAEYNGVACTWAELIDNKKWNLVKG